MEKTSNVSAEQVSEDLKKVIQEAQQLIKDTTQKQFSSKADAASRSLNEGMEQLRGAYDENRLRMEEAMDYGREQVHERPFAALGIALGAGALIGMLCSRRH